MDLTDNKEQRTKRSYLICLVPLILASTYWLTRPFADTLASQTISLSGLSTPQKLNIALAAKKLDGVVIEPHEKFSFNRIVGPRTIRQGFLKAPAYVGSETASSIGGGICLVSSCLYQTALKSGLNIIERVAHTRTISSVPPGLDATVWYGKDDLRFENGLTDPVQVFARCTPNAVTIAIYGRNHDTGPLQIHRYESRRSTDQLLVEVTKENGAGNILISRDLYRLSH
jgi:vancomycin resistance protein VanW